MKSEAIVLIEPGRLDVIEVAVPDPGPGEILMEVKANGICRGDIALFTGENKTTYPHFHGHEPVGVVAAIGPNVKDFAIGDKIASLAYPSYRRHCVVSSSEVIKIPGQPTDLALWIAEPPSCAVNGVQSTGFGLGQRVALIGCGYMGLLILQALPRETFSRLIVADPNKERLTLAQSFGAAEVYDPTTTDLIELANTTGKFDVVIEASGKAGTLDTATRMLRNGGTLNIFGWHHGAECVPTYDWHCMGLKVLNTSPACTNDFMSCFRSAIALMGTGRINQQSLITHRFPMSECQQALTVAASAKDGYVKGVITF